MPGVPHLFNLYQPAVANGFLKVDESLATEGKTFLQKSSDAYSASPRKMCPAGPTGDPELNKGRHHWTCMVLSVDGQSYFLHGLDQIKGLFSPSGLHSNLENFQVP